MARIKYCHDDVKENEDLFGTKFDLGGLEVKDMHDIWLYVKACSPLLNYRLFLLVDLR
jgi:hypothetical protein